VEGGVIRAYWGTTRDSPKREPHRVQRVFGGGEGRKAGLADHVEKKDLHTPCVRSTTSAFTGESEVSKGGSDNTEEEKWDREVREKKQLIEEGGGGGGGEVGGGYNFFCCWKGIVTNGEEEQSSQGTIRKVSENLGTKLRKRHNRYVFLGIFM